MEQESPEHPGGCRKQALLVPHVLQSNWARTPTVSTSCNYLLSCAASLATCGSAAAEAALTRAAKWTATIVVPPNAQGAGEAVSERSVLGGRASSSGA